MLDLDPDMPITARPVEKKVFCGWYEVEITHAIVKHSKSGDNKMLALTLQVRQLDPEGKFSTKQPISVDFGIEGNGFFYVTKGRKRLATLIHGLGIQRLSSIAELPKEPFLAYLGWNDVYTILDARPIPIHKTNEVM